MTRNTQQIVAGDEQTPATKFCSRCKQYLPFESFGKHKRYKSGLQNYCKQCRYAYNRTPDIAAKAKDTHHKIYERKKDEILVRTKQWHKENPERSKEIKKKYKLVHREKVLASGRDYFKKDYAKDPIKYKVRARNRDRFMQGVPGIVTTQEWKDRLLEFNDCCAYCREPLTKPTRTQDHMRPVTPPWNGHNVIENIIPACRSCNSSKTDRPIIHWLIDLMKDNQLRGQIPSSL